MSKDLDLIKNERIVYLMIITLLVLILAYTVLMNGNEGEKKHLLTESEALLRKEIVQLDKVINERENQVKGSPQAVPISWTWTRSTPCSS